jgi:hypothetical protein
MVLIKEKVKWLVCTAFSDPRTAFFQLFLIRAQLFSAFSDSYTAF